MSGKNLTYGNPNWVKVLLVVELVWLFFRHVANSKDSGGRRWCGPWLVYGWWHIIWRGTEICIRWWCSCAAIVRPTSWAAVFVIIRRKNLTTQRCYCYQRHTYMNLQKYRYYSNYDVWKHYTQLLNAPTNKLTEERMTLTWACVSLSCLLLSRMSEGCKAQITYIRGG